MQTLGIQRFATLLAGFGVLLLAAYCRSHASGESESRHAVVGKWKEPQNNVTLSFYEDGVGTISGGKFLWRPNGKLGARLEMEGEIAEFAVEESKDGKHKKGIFTYEGVSFFENPGDIRFEKISDFI